LTYMPDGMLALDTDLDGPVTVATVTGHSRPVCVMAAIAPA